MIELRASSWRGFEGIGERVDGGWEYYCHGMPSLMHAWHSPPRPTPRRRTMDEQTTETVEVYCGDCDARGVETRMVADADFDGHLCPVCEPIDVKMIGRRQERIARYDRLRTPEVAEAVREVARAIREVADLFAPLTTQTDAEEKNDG